MGTYQETSNETYISKSLYTYLTEIKNLKSHLLFLKCNNFPIWPLSNIHPTPPQKCKVYTLHRMLTREPEPRLIKRDVIPTK